MNDKNILVLAYLGDSIYEIFIRNYFVNQGISKVNTLQKIVTKYVSASGQAKFVTKMIENNYLLADELEVFYRGRNSKTISHPKNTDIITYKHATGLEAVIGYLHLKNDYERIKKIMDYILESGE